MSVEWIDRRSLREPILVCAFKGWNDAGEAASAAVQFLCEAFDADPLATIDPEDYYDFTAVRPTVRLVEGRSRAIDWPENSFHAARLPSADRDLIMLTGVEPSLRWKAFCDDITEVARGTGAKMIVTLGALLADVPHSRPVGIAVDATRLEGASEDYDRQVTAAVASDPDVKAFVERLEEMADEMSEEEGPPEQLPSGDVIAREFQRFLRQRGPSDSAET